MSEINFAQAHKVIKIGIATKRSVLMYGPPGIGKTDFVGQIAKEIAEEINDDFPVYEFRGTLHEPTDLTGIPFADAKKTSVKWLPPDFLPVEKDAKGVLFFDELGQSSPDMQKAMLGVMHERRIGSVKLPDGICIVAATNRVEDRAGVNRLITPMNNRMVHIDVMPTSDEWMAWATTAGIHPAVVGFIASCPQYLHDFKPALNERAFPTPRTWHYVSDFIKATGSDKATRSLCNSGTVGAAAAAALEVHLQYHSQLPDINKLLANPGDAPVSTEPAIHCHLATAIAAKFAENAKVGGAGIKYLSRLPSEYTVMGARLLINVHNKTHMKKSGLMTTPEMQVALEKMADLGIFE